MEAYPVTEFESVVEPDGSIKLPQGLKKNFSVGSHVIVRLTEDILDSSLRARGISEEEIEQIARLQMEQRADVVRFIKAEGMLRHDRGFVRRAKDLFEERT
ncbi:MAG: hypothetical protein HYZ33_00850 [Ignavibacteriales bacterium]|nr:hypothetical protein [Ignavibacteriales bacterium]